MLQEKFAGTYDALTVDEIVDCRAAAINRVMESGIIEAGKPLPHSTYAYDIERAITIVRMGLGAGFISRKGALDMILYAGEQARQNFDNWHEYGASSILGFAMWNEGNNNPDMFTLRRDIIHMLLSDPKSPWVTSGWWEAMPDEDLGEDLDDPYMGTTSSSLH